ncbi:cupin domain-containing protein [Nakamurella flava]|uniref:Cupin domain-containing protein n=1 Tax=Nakamurella flava TaxID=2576308 RepID=A0A4U6QE76_9ACTN|nr:cupin domain-containing protein [Nakamurella flava]TKV58286.1 cupin domain-containing protein [Nakamurella flava]
MTADLDPATLAAALDLAPLPEEGGLFRRTWANDTASAILFLLADGDFSALHRLTADEVYVHQAGAPLDLLLLGPSGEVDRVLMGTDVRAGQVPQLTVPAGWWQGSSSTGRWTLVTTIVSPPFEWDQITMGRREDLTARYPAAAERILALTRTG